MSREDHLMEPNLIAEDYRKYTQKRSDKYMDFIEISDDDHLLLGLSNLTGRLWSGSVWLFSDAYQAPEISKSLAGVEFEASVTDGKFLGSGYKIVVSDDTGAIHILKVVEVADRKTFYFSTESIACEHDDGIACLTLSSDFAKVVSGGRDRCIKYWDVENLTCEKSYALAHGRMVTCVAAQPQSNHVFTSTSLDGNVLLWDVRLERPASLLQADICGLTAAEWLNDHMVCYGSAAGDVAMADTRTKSMLYKHTCYTRGVHKLKYNSAKRSLAVCADDTGVIVLNCEGDSLSPVYDSQGHTDFVRGLAWDSKNLFSCGWDHKIIPHSTPFS